jgi:transcriptional regulator with XRE-family HTH domain
VTSSTAATPADEPDGFGPALRAWRERRHLSQLELSLRSGVSGRHLSFLETGRSNPSRAMVLQLAEHLDVPLRERDLLLAAAGFAPAYGRRAFDAPELEAVRDAVRLVLRGHEPYPAIAVDRCWNLLDLNGACGLLLDLIGDRSLLEPPVNVYRLALHPDGLVPHVVDLPSFGHHLLDRLRRDLDATGDPALAALLDEVVGYGTVDPRVTPLPPADAIVVPMRLRHPEGELALFSTVATFGTPADVTVAEVTLETFFPLDAATGERLRRLAGARTDAER